MAVVRRPVDEASEVLGGLPVGGPAAFGVVLGEHLRRGARQPTTRSAASGGLGQTGSVQLRSGYEVEDPAVTIPWGMLPRQAADLLSPHTRRVNDNYLTLECTSMGGLRHSLGLHFRQEGLRELEIFRRSYPQDLRPSYDEFQGHLEMTFGPPASSTPGTEGFPNHVWQVDGCYIRHLIYDRFGPEEHVRIYRPPPT